MNVHVSTSFMSKKLAFGSLMQKASTRFSRQDLLGGSNETKIASFDSSKTPKRSATHKKALSPEKVKGPPILPRCWLQKPVADGFRYLVQRSDTRCLAINPQKRLCTGRADQDPVSSLEQELDPVHSVYACDSIRSHFCR